MHAGKASIRHPESWRRKCLGVWLCRRLGNCTKPRFCKRVGACVPEKGAAADLIFSSYSIPHPLEL
ncbi:hypothetical protein QUB63_24615 [Microcoleus sp. ARI1-B5]|uniref:hypothetical protein n=1 Tax=unclassified Microcoleus TaxID=2642155 RepID=UPI002FCF0328